ncbi:hypothetical protein Tco_1557282 [Tanacetum coccineum]
MQVLWKDFRKVPYGRHILKLLLLRLVFGPLLCNLCQKNLATLLNISLIFGARYNAQLRLLLLATSTTLDYQNFIPIGNPHNLLITNDYRMMGVTSSKALKVQRVENEAKTTIFKYDLKKFTYYSMSRRSQKNPPSPSLERAREIGSDSAFIFY